MFRCTMAKVQFIDEKKRLLIFETLGLPNYFLFQFFGNSLGYYLYEEMRK